MRHRRRLGVVLVGPIVLAGSLWSGSVAYAECSQAERTSGACTQVTTDTDGDQVTIGRAESTPGTPGESSSSGGGSLFAPWSPPPPRQSAELGSSECGIRVNGLCRGTAPAKTTPPNTQLSPPEPPRFASELESFRPDRPGLRIEPDGWSVPRLPTNMVAIATRHRDRGELLGWPVEVRFTPVAYHWDFGDGTRRSTGTPGSRWSDLGAPQFSATATSHRYRAPGQYRVSLRVDYRVEFRFEGESFDDIDGLISRDAPSQSVDVLTVSPLLLRGMN